MTIGLLAIAVSAAVPLNIIDIEHRGGPDDLEWEWARNFTDELGERGDILQFDGGKRGEAAIMFNRFAYALAIMAFAPGGVRFCGMHFEATPTEPGGNSGKRVEHDWTADDFF